MRICQNRSTFFPPGTRIMKNTRLLLSTACIAIGLSFPSFAEPTNAELDQRLRAVEGTIATILELLKQQQGGVAAPVEASAATPAGVAPVLAGYQWGRLFMDVFSNPVSRDEGNALFERGGPSAPSNSPLASIADAPPTVFAAKQMLEYPDTARFDDVDGNLQLQWTGVFEAKAAGEHVFVVDLVKNAPRRLEGPAVCRTVARLNNEAIVDLTFVHGQSSKDFSSSKQGNVALEPGIYDFALFLTCWGGRDAFIEATEVSVRFIEPGQRSPAVIPSDRFGIRM